MAYPTPIDEQGVSGIHYSEMTTVTPSGSPFTITNPQQCRIQVQVSGGTVTAISLASDLIGLVNLGLLGGTFLLNPGHSLTVTYLIAPSIRYWCT